MKSKQVKLRTTYNGRVIVSGIFNGDRVFQKAVESWQKLLVLDAYGLDQENFQELKALGCQRIELTERDTGRSYTVGFDTFLEKAIPRQIGKFGLRYYLPLRYWG